VTLGVSWDLNWHFILECKGPSPVCQAKWFSLVRDNEKRGRTLHIIICNSFSFFYFIAFTSTYMCIRCLGHFPPLPALPTPRIICNIIIVWGKGLLLISTRIPKEGPGVPWPPGIQDISVDCLFFFFYILGSTGIWTQNLVFARLVPYHLNQPSSLCFSYFSDGMSHLPGILLPLPLT
jgi:hypothetical protein